MKQRQLLFGRFFLALLLLLAGLWTYNRMFYGSVDESQVSTNQSNRYERGLSNSINQSQETRDVPASYLKEMENGGRIEEITYASKDYADTNQDIEKVAFVYIPAGYDQTDDEKSYNILYLMHGWRMTARDFFQYSDLKNILDHMISNGDIEPMIVVTPTFDAENAPQDFNRSEEEIRNFYQDFRNNLVPFIEGRYQTYANSTAIADLQDSRDHRAFAGFSGGSVTTWSQFLHNLDLIKYFGPMSGDSWEIEVYGGRDNSQNTVDLFEKVVTEGKYSIDDYHIYAAT
ncbi:TPA: hypothetical protein U1B28_000398 [Streptococcus suis]|uniref:alpha/beta hydrolase n=1 Tax=Streptococcus suis TaxID=1307 RepID=UPI00209BA251|nr:alpha/beta hydrolase-fold protein [Streptococcus suis]MCO8174361.1 alpha/beta hydrolase-fold protein [Streptococcus suis]MCO8208761.1 alpha/beta hydrolase-fold protein [Streptococcus suis]HEM3488818.1 hypothetical protein [Streptococcus suis]HEM3506790.1 hypothetical protein [Streptococcus suis]